MLVDNEIYKEIGSAIVFTALRGLAFNVVLPLWYIILKLTGKAR